MIEGITILTQSPIEEPSYALVIIAALVTMTISLIISHVVDPDLDELVVWLITVILMILVGAMVANIASKPTDRYEYECTISEDVSFVEVLDQYEFVDQKGKIYVLRDKEV